MRDIGTAFTQMIAGRPTVQQLPPQPQVEGRILAVTSTTATFVVPDYDELLSFGPAPFGRTTTPPEVGDICVVAVVRSGGLDKPRIISWYSPE